MPAIVDASCMNIVIARQNTPALAMFKTWIEDGNGCIVFGGAEYRKELNRPEVRAFQIWLVQLQQAGRARTIDDEAVDAHVSVIKATSRLRSNDAHIIALAFVGKARVLVSDDRKLKQDFTDTRLLRKPKGRLYPWESNAPIKNAHRDLLRRHACK